jgi:hypothetical protein
MTPDDFVVAPGGGRMPAGPEDPGWRPVAAGDLVVASGVAYAGGGPEDPRVAADHAW